MTKLAAFLITTIPIAVLPALSEVQGQAPAPPTTTIMVARVPSQPIDRVTRLLRDEALAKQAEREAMFGKLRAFGGEPAPPGNPSREVKVEAQKNVVMAKVAIPAVRLLPAQPVGVAQVKPNNAQNNAMIQQWQGQMRPILKVEYQFMRTVCDPTKEQRKPIAHAGEIALREAAVKFVDFQFNRNRVVGGVVNRPSQPDPRRIIQDGLVAAVKANLPESLYQRYQKELQEREDDSKRCAIQCLVAKMDAYLVLSAEQRERIARVLEEKWDNTWNNQQAYFNIEYAYFPMIPDQGILPILNDSQKKAYAGTHKVMINSYGFIGGMQIDQGPLDDEFPDEPVNNDPMPEGKK